MNEQEVKRDGGVYLLLENRPDEDGDDRFVLVAECDSKKSAVDALNSLGPSTQKRVYRGAKSELVQTKITF